VGILTAAGQTTLVRGVIFRAMNRGHKENDMGETPQRLPAPPTKSRVVDFDTSRLTVVVLADRENLVPGTTRFRAGHVDKHVVNALRHLAKKVVVKPFVGTDDLLGWVKEVAPDVVFNLTEHVERDRSMDAHICALLDLLKVPYTGTGPKGLMLCRDKAVSKLIAAREGFKIPDYFVVQAGAPRLPDSITFPLVVKPRFGDASEGISQASLVSTESALLRRIEFLGRRGLAAVICEEFIEGREMYVGVLGRSILPVREFVMGRKTAQAPRLATYKLKHDPAHRRRWLAGTDFANLTPEEQARVERLARRTFAALDMSGYGRFDLKFTPSGEWVFLEANPNPGLHPYTPSQPGVWLTVDYETLIREIMVGALRRNYTSAHLSQ
jgi:D-alanine-D-alanine ligase